MRLPKPTLALPDKAVTKIADALLSIPDTAKRHEAFIEVVDALYPPTPREEARRLVVREALNKMTVQELGAAFLALCRGEEASLNELLEQHIPFDLLADGAAFPKDVGGPAAAGKEV